MIVSGQDDGYDIITALLLVAGHLLFLQEISHFFLCHAYIYQAGSKQSGYPPRAPFVSTSSGRFFTIQEESITNGADYKRTGLEKGLFGE